MLAQQRVKWSVLALVVAVPLAAVALQPSGSIAQRLADPLSIFAGRSPGTRQPGALFSSKPERVAAGARPAVPATVPHERVLPVVRPARASDTVADVTPITTALTVAEPILSPAVAATSAQPSFTDQLAAVVHSLPPGSSPGLYEAQFAALADRAGADCSKFRDAAIAAGDLPRNAYIGLQRLTRATTACAGTGAIGGGRGNDVGVPGFSVGGGSDYIR